MSRTTNIRLSQSVSPSWQTRGDSMRNIHGAVDSIRRRFLKVLIDRKSTRLNSSHTVISTLSLHDALPILHVLVRKRAGVSGASSIGPPSSVGPRHVTHDQHSIVTIGLAFLADKGRQHAEHPWRG